MKKTLLVLLIALVTIACKNETKTVTQTQDAPAVSAATKTSIHTFIVKDIAGEDFSLASLEGKKVLVVNTASKCGLTPQYEQLQALYEEYGGEQFEIIGFPANNFMSQEPGSNEEIAQFCTKNYGVSFPMMSKISVTGDDQHAVYQWLTQEAENGVASSEVDWNFQKYLINEDGTLAMKVGPRTSPIDPIITNWIESN